MILAKMVLAKMVPAEMVLAKVRDRGNDYLAAMGVYILVIIRLVSSADWDMICALFLVFYYILLDTDLAAIDGWE